MKTDKEIIKETRIKELKEALAEKFKVNDFGSLYILAVNDSLNLDRLVELTITLSKKEQRIKNEKNRIN